jgi:agmatine deiminase
MHEATWLSWPQNIETWPDGLLAETEAEYSRFVKAIADGEQVYVNAEKSLHQHIYDVLRNNGVDTDRVMLFDHKTNDAWCRDHGPDFVFNNDTKKVEILNWGYNAWGGKYPPYQDDDQIPAQIGKAFDMKVQTPGMILEGGSVELNGEGDLLTTKSCLLHKNRNPQLTQIQIEEQLKFFFGVQHMIWLEEGIEGDDTDGHIDDITRFVNPTTVVTCREKNRDDPNYDILEKNYRLLQNTKLMSGKQLEVIDLPMPTAIYLKGIRLPGSYANFYICNAGVIVPIFEVKEDDQALGILREAFPTKKVIGLPAKSIIFGLGAFHCLSKQQPQF